MAAVALYGDGRSVLKPIALSGPRRYSRIRVTILRKELLFNYTYAL